MSKILIIGVGSVGRRHLENLRALGCDDLLLFRTGKGQGSDAGLEGIPTEFDLDRALARQPLATIVANPTALHMETAIPAAAAGSHLFLEKPVSHSMTRLPELVEIVERKDLKVMTGFQFRFHPGLNVVKGLLEDGAIGSVASVQAQWGEYLPSWHPSEDYRLGYSARADLGGGVVLTLCHPIDYLRWLVGEIVEVGAMAGSRTLGLDVEDTAEVVLRFASGATGSMHLDYVQQPPSHHLKITGSRGTILWDNEDGSVRVWRSSAGAWERIPPPAGFERNTMFLDEMRHFLDCVDNDLEPRVALEDGIRTLRIALGILDSAREGHAMKFEW